MLFTEDCTCLLAGNGADVYAPRYSLDEVHGPVKSAQGYHLIMIEKRHLADFDFRSKEGALPKANVWDDVSRN